MNKRGFSHIEIVLAFVLFISVVAFALYFLELNNKSEKKYIDIDKIEDALKKEIYAQIRTMPISIDDTIENDIIAVKIPAKTGEEASVINISRVLTNATLNGNLIYFDSHGLGKKFKIFISEDIEKNNIYSSLVEGDSLNYTLGPYIDYEILSEKRAILLNQSYYSEYENLKNRLGIDSEFSIIVSSANNLLINCTKEILGEKQVFRKEIYEELLLKKGIIEEVKIEITTW